MSLGYSMKTLAFGKHLLLVLLMASNIPGTKKPYPGKR
jgi:hypothetical protein